MTSAKIHLLHKNLYNIPHALILYYIILLFFFFSGVYLSISILIIVALLF